MASSLLSVAASTSLESAGFTAVGEVMGCCVQHLGWTGSGYGCGYSYGPDVTRTWTSGDTGSRWRMPSLPLARALRDSWDRALARLLAEARGLGADGVVDIELRRTPLGGGNNEEFLAMGTAVRGLGRVRAGVPFLTDLSGQDVAKLLHAGWLPVGLAVGVSVGIRHDDFRTRQQATSWGNAEVSGYTDLVGRVRQDARRQFTEKARRIGGEVASSSRIDLQVGEVEPSDGHRDHWAVAVMHGTVISRFRTRTHLRTSALTVMPVRPLRRQSP